MNDDDCDDAHASAHPGAAEVCDGLDNNCAGDIDENNPGGGESCSTGLPGVCGAGTMICNGQDDNCNGNVDEGCPPALPVIDP